MKIDLKGRVSPEIAGMSFFDKMRGTQLQQITAIEVILAQSEE